MDRQDPPTDPAVNLLGVFIMFRQRKRCYDVTLSRQEGSTTRHLASAQSKDRLAGGDTGRLFLTFGGPVSPTGVSNCPLDRVLTYKNLIYLLNLQYFLVLEIWDGKATYRNSWVGYRPVWTDMGPSFKVKPG